MLKTLARKVYPPVTADAEILCRWVMPCELLPQGQAGFVRVNEQVYMLLPLADKGRIVGYRLTKSDGKIYDIDTTGRDWVCDLSLPSCRPSTSGHDCQGAHRQDHSS
jgi:hypothetical protein